MAVNQETDQSYGPFKPKFAQILKALSDAQINGDFPSSLPPWMVGLLVFDGTDPVSQFVCRNLHLNLVLAWGEIECMEHFVGAAPLTKCCLENHSQVRREIGDDDDATNQMMQEIQMANDFSTHFLTSHGYNGDAIKVTVNKVERVSVMANHSEERINMIAETTNHGSMWQAMGTGH